MIMLCYNQIRSTVMNGGSWSTWMEIKSGVRQGCNLSPKIFLLVMQILNLKLQQNVQILGITVADREIKSGLCADDIWNVTKFDQGSFQELLFEYSEFEDFTGLAVNYDKTEIMRVGSLHRSNAMFYSTLPLKWSDGPIKILGLWIHPQCEQTVSLNYDHMLDKMNSLLQVWSTRMLTPIGKIQIVNSVMNAQISYKLQCLPSPPKAFFRKYKKLVRMFIWSGKKAKISYTRLISSHAKGGLQLRDLQLIDRTFKVVSLVKVLRDNKRKPFWIYTLYREFPVERALFPKLNFCSKDIRRYLSPSLLTDICAEWAELNFHSPHCTNDILQQVLWFNSHIKTKKGWLFNKIMYSHNIVKIIDIFDLDTGRLMLYQDFRELNPQCTVDFVTYNGILKAIPGSWKQILMQNEPIPDSPEPWSWRILATKIKLSHFIYALLRENIEVSNTGIIAIWNNDLSFARDEGFYSSQFKSINKLTMCTKLRYFQYRLLCKSLYTNIHVAKWDPSVSQNCTFCDNAKETIVYLFIDCCETKKIWKALCKWLQYFHSIKVSFTKEQIIFSNNKARSAKLINSITLITKFYIYKAKTLKKKPIFTELIMDVNRLKCTELYIAKRQDNLYKFARKWDDFSVFD